MPKHETHTITTVSIYMLIDPRSNECRWIGKATGLLCNRLSSHITSAKRSGRKAGCANWIIEIISNGMRPEIECIEILEKSSDWREAEEFWISYMRFVGANLLNVSAGGYVYTEEMKRKQSKKLMGHIVTEKTKKKISEAQVGKKISNEQRLAISQSLTGRAISSSVRKKISVALSGKPKPKRTAEHSKAISNALKVRHARLA